MDEQELINRRKELKREAIVGGLQFGIMLGLGFLAYWYFTGDKEVWHYVVSTLFLSIICAGGIWEHGIKALKKPKTRTQTIANSQDNTGSTECVP